MHTAISKQARAELLAALRQRYLSAPKCEKSKALDEFVAVAGCHRKHAIRLRAGTDHGKPETRAIDRRTYGEAVREGLIVLWEAADRICGKRLKAVLPSLVEALERYGHLTLVPAVREQSLVAEGLDAIRRQFPVPVLGIDTDNDSVFINETLIAYCSAHQLAFTRSRPYRKNDQAWIEQKNGAVVRRFVGYDRFTGVAAGQCLGRLYQVVRLYVNHFQPSVKLKSKTREGARIKKAYHKPATPCERLLAHPSVSEEAKERLKAERSGLDPLDLLHRARECQSALAVLRSGDAGHEPGRESLAEFFAKLPEFWRQGEARPTHRKESPQPRTYRTRKDPFAEVWPEILIWLQSEPETTANTLLERLEQKYPSQFPEGQLRTLQRRVREWRRVMARELVFGSQDGKIGSKESMIKGDDAAT